MNRYDIKHRTGCETSLSPPPERHLTSDSDHAVETMNKVVTLRLCLPPTRVRGYAVAYFTTSIAVVAGLCIAFAVIYLFIGIRRSTERRSALLFGFFSLAYGAAIMTARAGFMAESVDEFAAAAQISKAIAAIGFALLIWFVAAYTKFQPRILLWALTGTFGVVFVAAALSPGLVVNVSGGVRTETLPWGETILMGQVDDAALVPVLLLALFVSIGYMIAATFRQYRNGDRTDARMLAVGIGWFIFTIVEETLVELEAIDFVFLSDFGFLGFVLAMGLQLVNSSIDTETELLEYRANLEDMVHQRSSELEEAHSLLVVQAEEQATVAERNRLARELHDSITQLLFSINLVAGSLPRLWQDDPSMAERSTGELQRLTRGALAEMRTLLRELRPRAILDTDLDALITHLAEGLAARQGIATELHIDSAGILPDDVHLALYRIAQEAMTNISKHADSSNLTVTLVRSGSGVDMSIVDDGYGFDQSERTTGMGLEIMRERAAGIGAALTVSSREAIGTTVSVVWVDSSLGQIP
jgi:signal transduction histidine kinase